MIEAFPSRKQFLNDPSARVLLEALEDPEVVELESALIYLGFPLYRDDEGGLVVPDVLLITPTHGVIGFCLISNASREEVQRCLEIHEQVPSFIHSRLIKNKKLRKKSTQLLFPIDCVIFDPSASNQSIQDCEIINSSKQLENYLKSIKAESTLSDDVFNELIASIDGAKGLVKPIKRLVEDASVSLDKGRRADELEASIMLFDQRQKHGFMGKVTGPQRIRGLAGSGKTVVLAMKAAQALLQNPHAKIAYTFSTKSLYQHVKRLITRFYRQFDDRDPDWENMHILHGWGGYSAKGLYSEACSRHGVRAVTFSEASNATLGDKLDYACKDLFGQTSIEPYYDYIFVDEAQDFPLSFLRLCLAFAKDQKFVIGYDDLQTIFQVASPDSASIFGVDDDGKPLGSFEEDVVLHKCYRNPREVLVTAHSIGFGIYGKKIVQMIESSDHWEDIGYKVIEGDFKPGSRMRVERPIKNSLEILSHGLKFEQLINVIPCDGMSTEAKAVASGIKKDLEEGLRAEDILVVCVDDRNAKKYFHRISDELGSFGIKSNNLHEDSFGMRDFAKEDRVTLSTVHKAKGNEAFMVYVIGCDAVMTTPDVRKRNMLFTAITRAKGWVRMSGCWDPNDKFPLEEEYEKAKTNFPELVFDYPGPAALKVMKRDLAEAADKKLKAERLIEELREAYSEDEIQDLLKGKQKPRKK